MVAQQGAVVHELSHVAGADHVELQAQADGAADKTCALCPAFAQVVTPAFSHSFHIPLLVRFALEPFQSRNIWRSTPQSLAPAAADLPP
jgi:hypothetical protein